jgi:hypothetical protein
MGRLNLVIIVTNVKEKIIIFLLTVKKYDVSLPDY